MEREGCTKERRRHSKIVVEPADVSVGGRVITHRNRDEIHCYLDFLKENQLLGEDPQASRRYGAGYELRDLYFSFATSGAGFGGGSSGTKQAFTLEVEIGAEKDLAQTRYHRVMAKMAESNRSYARLVRMICLEDLALGTGAPEFHKAVRLSLDSLFDALGRVPDTRFD